MTEPLATFLEDAATRTEEALERWLPPDDACPGELHRAMRYSVLAGGKRVRPALALLGARVAGGPEDEALPVACAYECVHTYSLVHDDLPAMDDDDVRRSQPSNHVVFGEALAILAGDALLTLAFEILCAHGAHDGPVASRLAGELAEAAGAPGMVGGQVLDIGAEEHPDPSTDLLRAIHRRKTAALIRGAVRGGAIACGAGEEVLEALGRYGDAVGLAFQVADDLLDVTATSEELGKTAGKDEAQGKLTYPALLGPEEARRDARSLVEEAHEAVDGLGPGSDLLRDLATYVVERGR